MKVWIAVVILGLVVVGAIAFGLGFRVGHMQDGNIVVSRVVSGEPSSAGPTVGFLSVSVPGLGLFLLAFCVLSFLIARLFTSR